MSPEPLERPSVTSTEILTALDQRLGVAAALLLTNATHAVAATSDVPGTAAETLLPLLLGHYRQTLARSELWLVATAVTGRFPTPDEVLAIERRARVDSAEAVEVALLELAFADGARGLPRSPMRVVTSVVVEVDYCARSQWQTGIQRVVREAVPRWVAEHEVTLVAWDDSYAVFRSLDPVEEARVIAYDEGARQPSAAPTLGLDRVPEIVVPWQTVIVFPDVPRGPAWPAETSLARFSGNETTAIGYDLIPITSADTRPFEGAVDAGQWLIPMKHAARIAAISESSAEEFRGYGSMMEAQGLPAPDVAAVCLPSSSAPHGFAPGPETPRTGPVLLLTGTREPHKNHRTLLYAVERLWHEGLTFEVRLLGHTGWADDYVRPAIDRMIAAGYPIRELGRVSEMQMWQALADADVVGFASLHEGYGLPVAEALAVGTPVVTTEYGSQAEIAADGGCITVNPRDDDNVTSVLRRVLTDGALRESLKREALSRPKVTWDEYADAAWRYLTGAAPTAADGSQP